MRSDGVFVEALDGALTATTKQLKGQNSFVFTIFLCPLVR